MKATRTIHYLLAIMLLAFSLRLLANHLFEGLHEGPSQRGFGADAVEFNAIGANLARHHEYAIALGHPTSFRAPGFPFLLAFIYTVAGANNFLVARLVFCLVGALLCAPVFLVGRRLFEDRVGLIAAALVAVYPNLLYYSIHFASEPLFTLLLTFAIWFWVRGWQQDSLPDYALSGLALGLAALTRPVAFYFTPIIVGILIWMGRRQWSRTLARALMLICAVVIPVLPWAIRNYQVHDRWLPFASNGGSTFWGANNELVLNDPQFHGQWISTERMGTQKDDVKQLANEVDRDRLEWEHGKQFVRAHLPDVPRLVWYKLVELWTPLCRTPNKKFNWIIGLSYGLVLPFILYGFWLAIADQRRRTGLLLLLVPVVGTLLSCLIFYGSARFRSTIEPFLLSIASIPLAKLLEHVIRSKTVTR